jgi:phenylalanyl-tRNA synthetase beta chain
MRPTLVPSIAPGGKLFEIDKVYPSENYKLAAVAKNVPFSEFKGVIDLILERLNIINYKIEFEINKSYLHPSKSGTIIIGEDILGEFGELHPRIMSALGIKDSLFCFELDVKLLESHSKRKIYESIPENPAQFEDITLTFPEKTRIGEVINSVKTVNRLISKIDLRDTYKDSYTFRIEYQDPRKTLTNDEVEKIRKEILTSVKAKYGGQIRE